MGVCKQLLWVIKLHLQDANRNYIYINLADTFIHSAFFISMCVPWELNPQPFALLTQCSTTEPQEHNYEI